MPMPFFSRCAVRGSSNRRRSSKRSFSHNLIAGLEARTLLSSYIESESNNTTATANVVTVPVQNILLATSSDWLQIQGSISASGDSDYFRFTLTSASGVFFDLDSQEIGLSTTLDTILDVFDVGGVAVPGGTADDNYDFEGFAAPGVSTGNATTLDAGLYLDLAAGDYFVRVRDFGTQTGNYYLKLLADATYSATVPVFDSLVGAADTLYLDFDGHAEASGAWGAFTAAAYNINNGNVSIFTPAERLAIRNVWTVVSEDFSPFNINVSTVAPPSIANGVAHRQVITSSSATIVGQSGTTLGVAYVGSYAGFANNDNVAFTFAENFSAYGGGTSGRVMAAAIEIGNTTSHEFGHALSLEHFDSSTLPQYILATPDLGLNRETWGNATNLNSVNQDDMAIISNVTNTFGYRVDDHGNTLGTATVLSPSGPGYVSSGVIAQIATDFDVFRFIATGPTTIRVDVNDYSNDLDTELRLFDVNGVLLATHDPSTSFDALITQTLAAGTYYVEVRSDGEAGEAGQYALTVSTDTTPPNSAPVLNDQTLPALPENSPNGTVVGTVAASDPDAGQTKTFSITAGNTGGAFAINGSTGEITVANVAALDFETTPTFTLTVQVTDNGSPNLSDTGTVTVNLLNSFEVTASALQAIVPLYQYPLSAPNTLSDFWQRILNEATADQPVTVIINPNSGPFDPALGGTDYANYLTGLSLLRANPNIRILGYVATGFGATASATVLQHAGWYASGYKHGSSGASLIDGIFLDEMSNSIANVGSYTTIATGIRALSGLAGHFIAGNPGTSVPEDYLTAGTADLFIIREGTPSDLLANPAPAYVTAPAYNHLAFGAIIHSAVGAVDLADSLRSFKLRGLDFGYVTDDTAPNEYDQAPTFFTAFLRDVHAPFIQGATFGLPENSANGTVVGTIVGGDPDAGQTKTFSITAGNTGGAFAINGSTGEITVANVAALDFETTPTFTLTVQVTDNGSPNLSDTGTVTINLTDVVEVAGDPDDQISEALVVTTEGSTNGTIGDLQDVDLYSFTVVAGQSVLFDIDARGGSPLGNSFLRLFSAAGTQLALDDNTDGLGNELNGNESFLRYTFTTSGTYYIGVSAAGNTAYNATTGAGDVNGTGTGDYTLHIGTGRVLDDNEAGYTFVGSWANGSGGFTGNAGGTAGDTKYVEGDGVADRFARALFTGLTAGQYRVSSTYRVGTTNATNATYSMFSGVGGTFYGSGQLNQKLAPNDFLVTNSFNSKNFEQVALVDITGTTLLVQLSDQGNGRIWADGIHIERIGDVAPGPKALVLDGATVIADDSGVLSFGASAPGVIVDKILTVRNTGDAPLTVDHATVNGTGYSLVSNIADGTVIAPGGQVTFTVRFTQPASGTYPGTISFGTTDIRPTFNPYNFALNAVVTETQYIDDGDPGYSTVGTWANSSGGRLTDVKYVQGDALADRFARWQFAIANPGQYRVMASWRTGSTNATNANYQVKTGVGGTVLGQAFLNQRLLPNDLTDATDALAPNSKWEQIAVVSVTGTTLLVELSDLADGRLYADSIRIERIGPLPETSSFTLASTTPPKFPFGGKLLDELFM